MFNENICSRHQPAISALQSTIPRKIFHEVSGLPERALCAASGWQAESSLYHGIREIKVRKKNSQSGHHISRRRWIVENEPPT